MPAEDDEIEQLQQDLRRRQIRGRDPQQIAQLLSDLMARRGYAQSRSSAQCEQAWQQAAGPKLAPHTRVGNLRGGVLEVAVRNSAVLQELTFQKRQMIKQLARLAPDQKIRDLKFRVGAID